MITQNSFEVQLKADDFYLAAKDSGLFTQLQYCGFRKTRGSSVVAAVFSLLTRVFCFSNLYWRMRSAWGRSVLNCGKDVFYDALTSGHFNWTKLCTGVAAAFVRKLRLNKDSRACFIIDDTIIGRPRSKKAELLARTYDHVFHRPLRASRSSCSHGPTAGAPFPLPSACCPPPVKRTASCPP